jgi:hypothetical protein
MPCTLQLLSGLLIRDVEAAVAHLKANFVYFDAVPVQHDSLLSVIDIVLQTMVNSRISGNTASVIFDHRAAIEAQLAQIPPDLDLIDVPDPVAECWLNSLITAVSELDKIHRVDVAVATKTLHKKLPGLIPMFDNFVGGWYRSVLPRGHRSFRDTYLCFHKDLRHAQAKLRPLVTELAAINVVVTHCRMLDYLIWFERRYP